MNEAETRAELIDPLLKQSGWGEIPESRIYREFKIAPGKIQIGGERAKPLSADYVLAYRGRKLAALEAKSVEKEVGEGVAQAKDYAIKMHLDYTFASNGKEIYQVNVRDGKEGLIQNFPTPDELWSLVFEAKNEWREKFDHVPFEDVGGSKEVRYYQEVAVNQAMAAISDGKQRILLTLATGTGKTFIAFQIAWKLYQTRWNLKWDGSRRPRVLFLADRNILADQAFNAFNAFPDDALIRIRPGSIKKKGSVPTNGSIFFTIFQTFMSGPNNQPYFGDYPRDYFDFVIIDECHRGGANDESNWREIMEYFSPAVQLGLTATPKRVENADTYKYFGEPVYVYSLKDGINDGFLTPFKVKRIQTTLDEYVYTPDDTVIEGEVEEGRVYVETDFNRIIEIKEREKARVEILMGEIDQQQKGLIFCATQDHALAIRDLINQQKISSDPLYCVRVTANDGALGEQYLREFQDNEKTIPNLLTTSQKLSTGVDARNIRSIVLLRPINTMIEFKQIIGRGTRLFDGKAYFTIYDFVGAYHHFLDPEWDGEPIAPEPTEEKPLKPSVGEKEEEYETDYDKEDEDENRKIKIKLRDGKEREIQHMVATSFWSADGKPISVEEYLQAMFGKLPEFFKDEAELRKIWSDPVTREKLLESLKEAGYGEGELGMVQQLIHAEKSDLFDVLEYIAFAIPPISREVRVARAQTQIFSTLQPHHREFLEFVLAKYIETGVGELAQEKLPKLLELKYQALDDAKARLGDIQSIRNLFINFQRHLYSGTAS